MSVSCATRGWERVLQRDPCSYCGARGGTVDHIIARLDGGTDTEDNYTGSCDSCNQRKCTLPLLAFLLIAPLLRRSNVRPERENHAHA
jgi:5-methylcytosine-specific restriction endonuclease McrA